MAGHWEHLAHGADIGIRGVGSSTTEAFEQAALAMTAVTADLSAIAPAVRIEITCTAADRELLLVEWLNAIIYEMATRRMLFCRFEVLIDGHQLTATAWGEAIDPAKHDLGIELKGATCTGLSVGRNENGEWHAQCVVDV